MEGQLGAEFPEYLQSLERPRAVALRLNPLKGKLPRMDFMGDPVPWEPMGYYYDPEARPGLHANKKTDSPLIKATESEK